MGKCGSTKQIQYPRWNIFDTFELYQNNVLILEMISHSTRVGLPPREALTAALEDRSETVLVSDDIWEHLKKHLQT